MKKSKAYAVSGELNESVVSVEAAEKESLVVEPSGVDTFLDKEEKAQNDPSSRAKSRQSIAKSLRESIGFITTQRYGEGRRVQEESDKGYDRTSKQRKSE